MPPTREMIDKAIACLGDTTLVRFDATPATIRAGETVTLNWEVSVPSTCGLSVRLNHTQVPKKGSRTIRPVRSVGYRLDCGAAGVSKLLGQVQVAVDSTNCSQFEIPEDFVRPQVISSVDASLAEYNANPENENKVSKRRETTVEIDPDGIVIRMRLKLSVNNFADPDVDVDAKIDVGVSPEGPVLAFYRSFAVDVDWPWWVTALTLGVSKIVEEFVDGAVEANLKSKILNDLRAAFQSQVDAQDGAVADLDTVQDAVLVTLCSSDGGSMIDHIVRPIDHELILSPV
ncbi:MAG: hypothetical protein HONBIEJF_00110 [Fimbriimonadaceae bacterium]|nr:hypothetical protein [Fimbriimonadaceae bacterium]